MVGSCISYSSVGSGSNWTRLVWSSGWWVSNVVVSIGLSLSGVTSICIKSDSLESKLEVDVDWRLQVNLAYSSSMVSIIWSASFMVFMVVGYSDSMIHTSWFCSIWFSEINSPTSYFNNSSMIDGLWIFSWGMKVFYIWPLVWESDSL